MEDDGFQVQQSRSSKSRRERTLSSTGPLLGTRASNTLPQVITQEQAAKQLETEALTSNETEREQLWRGWTDKLSQASSNGSVEYRGANGRPVTFESVLRSSNAVGLSVQTTVQVPGTAVANMLQSLEKLLASFSSPRLDPRHISRLSCAIRGFSASSSPDVIEAYRESLPAVISALLQTNAGVKATASTAPQTSAADIEAALRAQIEKANGTCTKEYVEGIVRVAKSAQQHAQLQTGAGPQPGATTGVAPLVALAEKQSQEAKDLATKRLSPKDIQAQAIREFAEQDRRLAVQLQGIAEEEAVLQAQLNDVLRRRNEVTALRSKLHERQTASLSQDPKSMQRRVKALDQSALDAQLEAARQLQSLLDGAAAGAPAARSPADAATALALYGEAATHSLKAGAQYLDQAKEKMQTTVNRLKRVQKQGEEIKMMQLPAAQIAANAKSQTLLQQAIAETVANAASVADACTAAALGLQQLNGKVKEGAQNGIDHNAATVTDLTAAVRAGMHVLQTLAAEVSQPRRKASMDASAPPANLAAAAKPSQPRKR